MLYVGRPGLWNDWQRFQAEARKSKNRSRKKKHKEKNNSY